MHKGSLLLVDDDRHILDSMADWLSEQGYRVDIAGEQTEARKILAKKSIDLVLADIRLREGDGFEILAHCRENHPETDVILITGYGTVELAIEAIRTGAVDFLTKPLIDEELEHLETIVRPFLDQTHLAVRSERED